MGKVGFAWLSFFKKF